MKTRENIVKRELLYKTLNIIFYMVLMIIVLSLLYSICMAFIREKLMIYWFFDNNCNADYNNYYYDFVF